MFKFLRKAAEVVSPVSTKETIEAIHAEFNSAGDKLLAEARDIIAGLSSHNSEKASALSRVGFTSTKEVVEVGEIEKLKKENESIAGAIQYYSVHFPQYKFITKKMAMAICEKYNLVLGEVSQYTGFVPQKNLNQISKFFEGENEINTRYTTRSSHIFSRPLVITKDQYEQDKKHEAMARELALQSIGRWYTMKGNVPLSIAAPLKDMKTDGYTLKDRLFSKEISDPVVMAPVQYNGIDLFCIITAWGEEASDPIVVNETAN